MSAKLTNRQLLVLRKMPCTAFDIPQAYRGELSKLEKSELIRYQGGGWMLTTKGLTVVAPWMERARKKAAKGECVHGIDSKDKRRELHGSCARKGTV